MTSIREPGETLANIRTGLGPYPHLTESLGMGIQPKEKKPGPLRTEFQTLAGTCQPVPMFRSIGCCFVASNISITDTTDIKTGSTIFQRTRVRVPEAVLDDWAGTRLIGHRAGGVKLAAFGNHAVGQAALFLT